MYGTFSIQDWGQPNPRQADVDRTRDAAARAMQAKATNPGSVTMDDVSLVRPTSGLPATGMPSTDLPGQSATA